MANKRKSVCSWSEKQPLPVAEIQRNADHGKTHAHLVREGDLPIEVLEKEIPKSDLHDM